MGSEKTSEMINRFMSTENERRLGLDTSGVKVLACRTEFVETICRGFPYMSETSDKEQAMNTLETVGKGPRTLRIAFKSSGSKAKVTDDPLKVRLKEAPANVNDIAELFTGPIKVIAAALNRGRATTSEKFIETRPWDMSSA